MTSAPGLNISKLDAARRQMETAIRLYFWNGDPVSIHTLTAASYQVLRDLTKARGATSVLMKDNLMDWIRPGKEKIFRDKLNEAENFFKHANKDPENFIEFNPRQSEMLLFEACTQYQILTSEVLPIFQIFKIWFTAHNTSLFNLPSQMDEIMHSIAPNITSKSRPQFFQETLPTLMAYTAS